MTLICVPPLILSNTGTFLFFKVPGGSTSSLLVDIPMSPNFKLKWNSKIRRKSLDPTLIGSDKIRFRSFSPKINQFKVGSRAFCMFNNIALFYYFTSTWNSGTCGYQIREDWSILRVIQFLYTLRRKVEILIILKISFFLQSPERCTTQGKIHEKNTKYSYTRV